MKSARYFVLLISAFFTILLPAAAIDVEWRWNVDEDSSLYFRYQINGTEDDGWIPLERGASSVITPDIPSDEETVFCLQSSRDGVTWAEPACAVRTRDDIERERRDDSMISSVGFRQIMSPYSVSLIDFYNGHDIKGAKYLTSSVYGLSLDTEVSLALRERFSYFFSAGWTLTSRKDPVIPGSGTVNYVRLIAGNDLLFGAGSADIGIGAFAGAYFAFNADVWSASPAAGMRAFIEWPVTPTVSVGAMSRFSLTYHGAEDPLMKSLTWIIDPISVTVTWRR